MPDNTGTLAATDPYGLFPRRWLKALQDAGASRLGFLVLCDLATYADSATGKAYPSLDTIAADLHVHVRKVKAAVAELKTIPGPHRAAAQSTRSHYWGTAERIYFDHASRLAQETVAVAFCAGEAW
jgi:hypothetical protein